MPSEKLYQEVVEDINSPALVQLITEVRDGQRNILGRMDTIESDVEKVLKAFPEEDVEGHRRYHQTMAEDAGRSYNNRTE